MIEELFYGKDCSSVWGKGVYIGKIIPGRRGRGYHCVLMRNDRKLNSGEIISEPSVIFFTENFEFSKDAPRTSRVTGYTRSHELEVPRKHREYALQVLKNHLPLKQ